MTPNCKIRSLISMAVGLMTCAALSAQSVSNSHWFNGALYVQLDSSNQWNSDISYRTRGERWSADQLFIRTAFRHAMGEHWKGTLGTNITFQYPVIKGNKKELAKEYRIWQELSYEHRISTRYRQEYRVRAEERWFSETAAREGFSALRMRYRIAGWEQLSKRWTFQWSEEYLHQHTTEWIYNHNRLSVAMYWQYVRDWQFQGIYYWAHYSNRTQHIFVLGAQKRMWLHGSKQHR